MDLRHIFTGSDWLHRNPNPPIEPASVVSSSRRLEVGANCQHYVSDVLRNRISACSRVIQSYIFVTVCNHMYLS